MKFVRGILLAFLVALSYTALAEEANQPITYRQLAVLTSSDGMALDGFGLSIATSGNILVAGAPAYDNNGRVYVFAKPPSGWAHAVQVAELTPSDAAPSDGFGAGVVISGNAIVVADSPTNGQLPREYVFVEPAGGWANMTETAQLTLPNGDILGSVAITGNTIVAVGTPPNTFYGGAIYVFEKPRNGWTSNTRPQARLSTTDSPNDLGYSLAFNGNTIAASSPSYAVYVFSKPTGSWANATQTAKLTLAHETGSDEFGNSVAIAGGLILVGAVETGADEYYGAAYTFYQPATGWVNANQSGEIFAPNSQMWLFFGASVSANPSLIAIGADGQYLGDDEFVGAVYLFQGGTQIAELVPDDPQNAELMGGSVAISGTTVFAGARGAMVGSNSQQGEIYIFAP